MGGIYAILLFPDKLPCACLFVQIWEDGKQLYLGGFGSEEQVSIDMLTHLDVCSSTNAALHLKCSHH